MITKQQIESCNDGQQLAELYAVEILGLSKRHTSPKGAVTTISGHPTLYYRDDGRRISFEPHLPTEKGMAQCLEIIFIHSISIEFLDEGRVELFDRNGHPLLVSGTGRLLTAIIKAALLSEIGE